MVVNVKFDLDAIEYNEIRTNKKKTYINLECAFDIETTSTYVNGEKVAFMYLWTMGLGDGEQVIHGRTWEEFIAVCKELQSHFNLSENRILICYVHNLSFEFQFMRKYFEWIDVFSVEERKPIKALCSYGIEFRDSYILSNFSLSKLAENLINHKIRKLEGDLDYDKIRHHATELTSEELQYAVNDVVIILNYINEQIELYGDITKIPLTNTGRVRSYVRNNCYYTNTNHRKSSKGKYIRYRKLMEDLELTEDVYKMCKRAFMGGFTHANANYTGKVVENVTSIDFSSSYPAVMLTEFFPMSRGIPTTFTKEKDFNWYRKNFALVFDVRFTNIRSKIMFENYISESKCFELKNPIINNGRIHSAEVLATTITDVDFNIIENAYEWDSMQVANVYRFYRGYLPKPIIESVIKLYEDKTVLKNVEGKEVEYMISKGMLNSVYGMCVTDIVRDEIIYEDDWNVELANSKEQIEKYNKSKTRFLYYPWGVWITAYARRNLWLGIMTMKDDYIYSDTDSIKFKNYDKYVPFIEQYNSNVLKKLKRMCEYYQIDFNKLSPKTKDGVVKPIGVWELDGVYTRFKTLGAKRYLVEYENGEMEMTVAGLSKSNGIKYLKQISKDNTEVFERFNDEMYIPAHYTGKMTHTYIDDRYEFSIIDYRGVEADITVESSVHLEKADFTLSISRHYIEFIKNLMNGYVYRGLDFK